MIHVRQVLPQQKAQYLIEVRVPDDLVDTLKIYRLDLDIHHRLLTPALSVVTEILEPLRRREERADYPEGARRVLEEMEKLRALIRG